MGWSAKSSLTDSNCQVECAATKSTSGLSHTRGSLGRGSTSRRQLLLIALLFSDLLPSSSWRNSCPKLQKTTFNDNSVTLVRSLWSSDSVCIGGKTLAGVCGRQLLMITLLFCDFPLEVLPKASRKFLLLKTLSFWDCFSGAPKGNPC